MRDDFVVFIITHGKTGFIKRVRWNNLLPQIINEKWRKGYEK